MQSVLLIDDDADLGVMLEEYLSDYGFRLEVCARGDTGVMKALKETYDLLLVDVTLPGIDGFTVVRQVRAASAIPIILLTARGADIDRIVGLEIGADDYLPKPFNPRELVARIRAILRRPTASPSPPSGLSTNALHVDSNRRTASLGGHPLPLTDVEFLLLEFLLSCEGKIASRDDLAIRLLVRSLRPFERSIDVSISRLRKKLETAGLSNECLRTIRNEGYMLLSPSVTPT